MAAQLLSLNTPVPDISLRTLDDDAVDSTLLKMAAGRKLVIGERQYLYIFKINLLVTVRRFLDDEMRTLPRGTYET